MIMEEALKTHKENVSIEAISINDWSQEGKDPNLHEP